jgi:hypothetical protein
MLHPRGHRYPTVNFIVLLRVVSTVNISVTVGLEFTPSLGAGDVLGNALGQGLV